MTPKPMIVTSYEKAVRSLEEVLQQPKNVFLRDATIQRFEYTFELAVRMMQRYFQEKGPQTLNVDALTYNDLCRMATEAELITNSTDWFDYRDARNKTSHAYDEEKAEDVFQTAKRFLPEAQHLLEQLKRRV